MANERVEVLALVWSCRWKQNYWVDFA